MGLWKKRIDHAVYAIFDWSRSISWKETALRFKTSWDKVFRSVEYIVEWGLKNRSLEGITAIGVDEIMWKKGHKYLTLVYQINSDCLRLLWITKDRTEKSFSNFSISWAKKNVKKLVTAHLSWDVSL